MSTHRKSLTATKSPEGPKCPTEKARAHDLVARLSTCSQGTIRNYAPQPGHGDLPLFPASGYDRRDDREADFALKSHGHFVARLKGCRVEKDYKAVADDAQRALDAYRRTAKPPKDSEAWREQVGRQGGRVVDVAREWGVSPSYVYQLRQRHKPAA
jgi:hypothetical protein